MTYIGAHTKKAKTIIDSINAVISCKGNALQLFVSSPLSAKIVDVDAFKLLGIAEHCKKTDFRLVIHAPYIINLAMEPKNGKRLINIEDCYWVKTMINQLMVSDAIGAVGIVVHVGKHTKHTPEAALGYMHNAMAHVAKVAKDLGLSSRLILETPAGAGTELLRDPRSFVDFYNSFTADEKMHLGICIDTAHVWSSGYDINDYFKEFEGNTDDIDVIHLNNSKKTKGSRVDLHDTILCGNIPLEDIAEFVKNLGTRPIVILETPSANLDEDIEFVKNSLCKEQKTFCEIL